MGHDWGSSIMLDGRFANHGATVTKREGARPYNKADDLMSLNGT
jgi:hypothetical protein